MPHAANSPSSTSGAPRPSSGSRPPACSTPCRTFCGADHEPARRSRDMKKLEIDIEKRTVTVDGESHGFASAEAFAALSHAWLQCGWDAKHVYGFSWMGRPIIQLPDDLVRIQEVVWALQPDVIVETGVAHGRSLIFYASLCKAIGRGRVIGVDIEIRPHNRQA